jgi:exosortase/archaeosortase family protein
VSANPSRKELLFGALKFIAFFLAVFAVSYAVLTPLRELNGIAAYSTKALLSLAGKEVGVEWRQDVPFLTGFGVDAAITDLCAAKIELAVLAGIVFASFDRTLRQRFHGFLVGAAFALVLNPARIATTLVFFNPNSLVFSTVLHDVVFRISLIAAIVGYYALWYYWLSEKLK